MTTDPAKNDEAAAEEKSSEAAADATTEAAAEAVEASVKVEEAAPKAEAAAKTAADKPKPPAKPEAPARDLPSNEQIAAWAKGAEVGNIGILLEGLEIKRFDTFVTQIRAKDMLPQHWQIISASEAPEDSVFDGLPEVKHLAKRYGNAEKAARRLGAMKVAWRELRGKRPGLWQVPDLLAALRRIIDKGIEVDFNELLSGARDQWLGMTVPDGQVQADTLWAVVDLIRTGTKK